MRSLTYNVNTQNQDTTLERKGGQIYLLLCCSRSHSLLELIYFFFFDSVEKALFPRKRYKYCLLIGWLIVCHQSVNQWLYSFQVKNWQCFLNEHITVITFVLSESVGSGFKGNWVPVKIVASIGSSIVQPKQLQRMIGVALPRREK